MVRNNRKVEKEEAKETAQERTVVEFGCATDAYLLGTVDRHGER